MIHENPETEPIRQQGLLQYESLPEDERYTGTEGVEGLLEKRHPEKSWMSGKKIS